MSLPTWALYMKKVYADPTLNISQEDFSNKDDSQIIDTLYKNLSEYYERKKEQNKDLAFPVIKNVFEMVFWAKPTKYKMSPT